MTNKKKMVTATVAIATAATLMLGGTYAWQSISQTALNEKEGTINPGGRLHDDFNGTNKDVYVENFASEKIFARVRLDEYFEYINNKGNEAEQTNIVTEGANKGDTSTYHTHLFGEDNATDAYWEWTTGGSTTYMPTFNKNKDSLEADINGTLVDDYEDYVTYEYGDEKSDTAVYDNDANSEYDGNVTYKDETHYATGTKNAELISMQNWIDIGSIPGEYWVYDTDGWVYWADAIDPDTATGLLLDGIAPKQKFDDSYYYAIEVTAQFVTADDVGKDDNTGFYDTDAGTAPSANAEKLLKAIGVEYPKELNVSINATSDYDTSRFLTIFQLSSAVYYGDDSVDNDDLESVEWSIEGNTSDDTQLTSTTDTNPSLIIGDDETGNIIVHLTVSYKGLSKEGTKTI